MAEAMQWGEARQQAAAERQSEWSTLCATADKDCPHGHACSYNHAAAAFFAANSMSLSRVELAVALRNILVTGPAKTTRVPMIVGPINSGKSTLVLPFDELYGFAHVFTNLRSGRALPCATYSRRRSSSFGTTSVQLSMARELCL